MVVRTFEACCIRTGGMMVLARDTMPDYDSAEWEDQPWRFRFPEWAVGAAEWRDQPDVSNWQDNRLNWLPDLRTRDVPDTPLACPRLFVSHRSADRDLVLRVAWMPNPKDSTFGWTFSTQR
jgi:hypothetical protein